MIERLHILSVIVMNNYLDDPCFYVLCLCYMFFMSATLLFVLLPVLTRTLLEKRFFLLVK